MFWVLGLALSPLFVPGEWNLVAFFISWHVIINCHNDALDVEGRARLRNQGLVVYPGEVAYANVWRKENLAFAALSDRRIIAAATRDATGR